MTTTYERAVRSLKACAKANIKQAKQYRQSGRQRMAAYHLNVAKDCRRDARLLKTTAS